MLIYREDWDRSRGSCSRTYKWLRFSSRSSSINFTATSLNARTNHQRWQCLESRTKGSAGPTRWNRSTSRAVTTCHAPMWHWIRYNSNRNKSSITCTTRSAGKHSGSCALPPCLQSVAYSSASQLATASNPISTLVDKNAKTITLSLRGRPVFPDPFSNY